MHWYKRFHSSKKTVRTGFWVLTCFVLTITLFYNIVLSQTISPLYSKFFQDEKKTAGTVLRSIQSLPEFNQLYTAYKNRYGTTIENEVFAKKKKDALFVNRLLETAKITPESRDVNYNLWVMLEKTKNDGTQFLIRAKQIDPEIQ